MKLSVSVIIPVYNAAPYVTQAVKSALAQPEVDEVVLIEDHSPDNSLEVCRALAQRSEKVYLYQHPGGVNRGAGPSRNLGIEKSISPFVAFLDADDFYLPERFTEPAKIFTREPDCDGVYEAVGIHFENNESKQRWLSSSMAEVRLTTMDRLVPPDDLFRVLIKGGSGHIHLNGLIIKRSILAKSGLMNPSIADTLHEDVDFVLKLAAVGILLPGRIDQPTSMRRVHMENRVSAPRDPQSIFQDKMRLRLATYHWCKKEKLEKHQHLVFKRMLWEAGYNKPVAIKLIKNLPPSSQKSWRLLTWLIKNPEVGLEALFWRELGSALWGILRNDILHLDRQ